MHDWPKHCPTATSHCANLAQPSQIQATTGRARKPLVAQAARGFESLPLPSYVANGRRRAAPQLLAAPQEEPEHPATLEVAGVESDHGLLTGARRLRQVVPDVAA